MTEFSTPQIFPVTKFGAVQTAGRLKSVTTKIVSNLLAYLVETGKIRSQRNSREPNEDKTGEEPWGR